MTAAPATGRTVSPAAATITTGPSAITAVVTATPAGEFALAILYFICFSLFSFLPGRDVHSGVSPSFFFPPPKHAHDKTGTNLPSAPVFPFLFPLERIFRSLTQIHPVFAPSHCSQYGHAYGSSVSSSSRRLSRATRTASTTKAEKVQSFPRMTSSTSAITSTGNRILFGSVAGMLGILNFLIRSPQLCIFPPVPFLISYVV